ncbi:MAG: DeoR/GlpR family DNA-binding transcription regulator [Ginsengibacter sp.]
MLKKERQAFIIHKVNLHNKILSGDLSQEMNVSEDTIRRDLNELADLKKIIKVHGGALSKSFHNSFQHKNIYSLEHKKIIAQKGATLIKDGMFVLTTGGTTIIELAKALPEQLNATFFTGSLPAAFEYMHHPNIEVIIIGDRLSKNSQITVGGAAISKIKEIKADIAFLGINAIDVENGITDNDWDIVQLKQAMIESSSKVVALSISEKVNTTMRLKVCNVKDIDILITELKPDNNMLACYAKSGIEIM